MTRGGTAITPRGDGACGRLRPSSIHRCGSRSHPQVLSAAARYVAGGGHTAAASRRCAELTFIYRAPVWQRDGCYGGQGVHEHNHSSGCTASEVCTWRLSAVTGQMAEHITTLALHWAQLRLSPCSMGESYERQLYLEALVILSGSMRASLT
jgi:hypothetical protein